MQGLEVLLMTPHGGRTRPSDFAGPENPTGHGPERWALPLATQKAERQRPGDGLERPGEGLGP